LFLEIRLAPNEFTEEFSMGSCGILGSIQALDAKHPFLAADTELTQAIIRTSSGNCVDAAATTGTAQLRHQYDSGQTAPALLKRGRAASSLSSQASDAAFERPIVLHRPAIALNSRTKFRGLGASKYLNDKGHCIYFSLKFVSLLTIRSKNQKCGRKNQATPLAKAAGA
jgi:hypothetical protein